MIQRIACYSLALVMLLGLQTHRTWAQDSDAVDEPDKVDFATQVLPILSDKCFLCHGPDTKEQGLVRLDSFAGATADLGDYRAIDANDPKKSHLIERIFDTDDPMPPVETKPLSADEKATLRAWVLAGGDYAKHWAFVPPKRAEIPVSLGDKDRSRTANPIDAFIAEPLGESGISFAPQADRSTLARRIALTLIGLPPPPEVRNEFLQDRQPNNIGRYIDRLMELPAFGEHQARYWLDAIRYGDTHGLHLDNRRGIYPYRDWVIRSLNRNLPFDQFLVWQLAGDLLEEPTLEQKVATGFIRMNPSTSEGGAIAAEFQAKNSFDRAENIGTVLLGLTLNCARCHTHKYDPVPHEDYYRFLAFFNNTSEGALDGNKYAYGNTVLAPPDQDGWSEYETLEKKRELLISSAERKFVKGLEAKPKDWDAVSEWEKLSLIEAHDGNFRFSPLQKRARNALSRWELLKKSMTTTLVARERETTRETRLLHRGEYDQPRGDALQPNILSAVAPDFELDRTDRLGLARWIVSRDNPLTARVLVNRIWQRVFRYGLVRTPEDFGLQGQQPTHPELLDWLAVEFQDSGWDLQHLLKLMLTSRTFQQSSAWREGIDDPENRLYARGPSYRLDAEVLRDTGLWASGLLDPTLGGEGVKPYQPVGMWKAMAHPASNTKEYKADEGRRLYRKSVYVYWKRTSPHPMMTLFDAPDRESSCVRRSNTSTSLQSLALFNETQRVEIGRKLAEKLLKTGESDSERLRMLFELIACRKPNESEADACLGLLDTMRSRFSGDQASAEALLSQGNAEVDTTLEPSEIAAWAQVSMTVLASDIALVLN
ncbi:MAG: PSD1 and planctomycete cytochrome C domain-containing protein [Pirellulaceae bacterium]